MSQCATQSDAPRLEQFIPQPITDYFADENQNISETERWISLAAGGLLLPMAMRKGPVGGLLTLGVAAGLIYRGLSGHCQLYQSLGVCTAEK